MLRDPGELAMTTTSLPTRRILTMSTVLCLVAAVLAAVGLAAAPRAAALLAGPGPILEPTASNVTADALPTVQIDGVVWSQAIVGSTVYAGGNFANARPAGAAAGTSLTPRSDLLSYNISTGVLNTAFAPTLNGQVKTVAASPDGSRIYVGGTFTTVDGATRSRIAAFSTATGALITTFKPIMSTQVNAIAATNTTVYVGGVFTTANGVVRNRLAAFNAADGALTAWNPNADFNVNALVITPNGGLVIAGGAFQNVGAQPEYGMAAIDATTGAVKPWAANQTVRNAGTAAAILSLSTDGTAIYGTGYVFGVGGNLEGAFSADPLTGSINWIEDCHGDTYSAFSMNNVVYTVSHSHLCKNVGSFPQTDPWTMHRALAWTTNAVGTIAHDNQGYFDWFGKPAPSQYNWYPDLTPGTFTGQGQAAWEVTGNGQYLVMGGEFTSVNFNGGQQGLVRFAVRPIAPGREGPRVAGASFVPTIAAVTSHSARVSWTANWDRDNQNLSYKVIRNDNAATPVFTTTATSQFWNEPRLSFLDTGLSPGVTYTYKVTATDPTGITTQGADVSVTMPLTDRTPYAQQVLNDVATNYWRLGEASGTTGADVVGANNLVEGTGVGHGAAGAITGETDKAATFNGTATGTAASANSVAGPPTFSVEAWVKTTTAQGGEILAFGSSRTGNSTDRDRQLYMDNAGHIYFGAYPGAVHTVHSVAAYNNGLWHHIVGTVSTAGMTLYVDGAQVGFDATTTTSLVYTGFWRVGGDSLASWPAAPTSNFLAGSIDEVAVYSTALTAAQVKAHFLTGTGAVNQAPVAAFTQSCTNLACSFNGSTSSDPDGTVAGYAWSFGDGATASGATTSHTYATGGTFTVTLTVTDNRGATNSKTGTVTLATPTLFASDAFGRTVSSGWGSADVGGAWTVGGVPAASFSVSAGTGAVQMAAAGAQPSAYLNSVSVGDSDSSVDFTLDKAQSATSNLYAYLVARHTGTSQYRLRLKQVGTGGIQLSLTKVAAGTETVLTTATIAGLAFTPGQFLRMRLRVSGTTSVALSGKAWSVGSAEPATWQVTATDASAPLGPGGPGFLLFLSSVATNAPVLATVHNVTAGPITGP
jgi:hypothetical protein